MAGKIKDEHRVAWVLGVAICAFMGLMLLVFLAVNIFMRLAYSSFYTNAEPQFAIPGLDEGFIPQDLDYLNGKNIWLFSGYMTDGPSPIYIRQADGTTKRIFVKMPDGVPYDGHGSGITSNDKYVFLTRENGLMALDAQTVATAEDGVTVPTVLDRDLDFSPAFMNIENDTLYLGNFYRSGNYETPDHHHIAAPDGTVNPAVMYAYPADDSKPLGFADTPERVYSITNQIQGMCESPSGEIVLSQSYGLASSHLLVYDTRDLQPVGTFTADGVEVPLYSLNSLNFTRDIDTPPMSEGIEFHNDCIWVTYESASERYFFGKLYGCGQVFSLVLD